MSGFEVIGVVLGAAPLIISALEAYSSLGKKLDAFKRKSLHIDRMLRALKWQEQLIHSDIKIVLRNAGFEETTNNYRVGVGHYHELLMRPDVQDAISSFLGDNCSAYLEIIQQCENTLLGVAKAVRGFNEDSWIVNGSLAGMVHANRDVNNPSRVVWKRLKFSMHKDDLERNIKEIDEFSRLLERLREKSQQEHQVTVQASSSSTKAVVSMLRKVQLRTSRLYRALAQSWTRSCQDSHGARLYLDYRIDTFEASRKSFVPHRQNKFEFSITLQGCHDPQYHACAVEVLNLDDFEHSTDVRRPVVSFTPTTHALTAARRLDVDNICRVLNDCTSTKQSLRLYLAENEMLRYEHELANISGCKFRHVQGGKVVSLRDLLQDSTYRRALQLKTRVKLAAIMASSVLQLHATPWCKSLRTESFLFAQDLSGEIDLKNPFIACCFDGIYNTFPPCSPQAESELLDLGILILELWHKEAMGSFAAGAGLTLEDTYDSRQSVARKWIAETKDSLLTSVYDAAMRCVNCRFDAVNIDLTDYKLNISIFEGVVKPLWENCRN